MGGNEASKQLGAGFITHAWDSVDKIKTLTRLALTCL